MTEEEARGLRPGQLVESNRKGLVYEVGKFPNGDVLQGCIGFHPTFQVRLRRPGLTPGGKNRAWFSGHVERFRVVGRPPPPPAPANVYADWLEEHGEPAAAAKLRLAFPLGPEAL